MIRRAGVADVQICVTVRHSRYAEVDSTHLQELILESATMHAEIVEGLATKSAAELRELMRQSLTGWKDDMLKLLFSDN